MGVNPGQLTSARPSCRRRTTTTATKRHTMTSTTTMTKDPVCGMSVDETKAVHAERDGKTFYFCSDMCLQSFLTKPDGSKPKEHGKDCCA